MITHFEKIISSTKPFKCSSCGKWIEKGNPSLKFRGCFNGFTALMRVCNKRCMKIYNKKYATKQA